MAILSHSGHHHGHAHHKHAPKRNVLLIAIIIAFAFAAVEAIGGWLANSLTLLSDAGHMVTDAMSLVLAAFAAWIARRPPSIQHTYGLGRAEVLGAWFSSLIMVILVIYLAVEALERLAHPQPVKANMVMLVGFIGILVNLVMMWLLKHGEKTYNMRAAMLHVMSDLLGSVAAFVAGIVIYFSNWYPIDPLLSLFICALILFSSFQLLRETLLVLMEGVPPHLDIKEIGKVMAQTNKVIAVHDLHIWTLSSGMIVLTAHVEIEDILHWQDILDHLHAILANQFEIHHVTLQPESRIHVVPFHSSAK